MNFPEQPIIKRDTSHGMVVRTIRNGKVRIMRHIFTPSDQWRQYDGRLEGMRYAFGLYRLAGGYQHFVYLWGPERAYCEHNPELSGPEVVDGMLPWCFWKTDEQRAYDRDLRAWNEKRNQEWREAHSV